MKKQFCYFLTVILIILIFSGCALQGGESSGGESGGAVKAEIAKRFGRINSDYGYGITVDLSGNFIVTGYVTGNADLNGDGTVSTGLPETATAEYGSTEIFISKFDSSGTYQWSKRIGGKNNDIGNGIAADSTGNIIVTGYVTGNADLNGDGTVSAGLPETATAVYGSSDIFISKFDSSGVHQWSKRLGGTVNDIGHGIAADTGGNIIVTGKVTGNADLNGDGSISAGLPETATAVYGGADIFITKFNLSGVYQWSKRLGGTDDDIGRGIAADSTGNIFVTGSITGNADLNEDGIISIGWPETAASPYGNSDIFVTKFNASGAYQWIKRLGGSGDDNGNAITVDSGGNFIVAGSIYGNADLNGDVTVSAGLPETVTAVFGSADIFISKFDSSGTYQWSKRLGGTSYDYGYGITADTGGNFIVAGSVNGNADLNGDGTVSAGLTETVTATYGDDDVFITKFNSIGTHQWSKRLGGAGYDRGYGIAAGPGDILFVTGSVDGNGDINGDGTISTGMPETAAAVYGTYDIFISKFDSSGVPK